MDSLFQEIRPEICNTHNLPIVYYNQQNNKALCQICFEKQPGLITIEQIQQQSMSILKNGISILDGQMFVLKSLQDSLLIHKNNLISSFDKILQIIFEQITTIDQKKKKYKEDYKSSGNQLQYIKDSEVNIENIKNNHKLFRDLFIQQIKNFQQKFTNIDHILKLIDDNENIMQQEYCTGNNVQEIDIQQVKQDQQQIEKIQEIQRMDQDQQLQNSNDQQELIQKQRIDQQQFEQKFQQKIIKNLNTQYQNSKGIKGNVKNIIKEVQINQQQIMKEFQYQLIEDKRIKLEDTCYAFAFNNENSILFVACGKIIIVYEFDNGKIKKELQRLDEHTDCVVCLYFMQKSKSLVSGSHDNSILIWEADQYNQWLSITILKDYKQQVNCLLMNKSENIIFSGNQNNQIKIWKKENDFWNCKQTIRLKDSVFAISLNEMENKLISCGDQSKINVMEMKNDKNWSLVQEIKTSNNGFRLCFIQDNQFAFQPCQKNYLEIYDYDNYKTQFQRKSQIYFIHQNNCQKYFPCQFIKSLNILTVKNGKHLNIFKINQFGNYELIQTIIFCCYDFFGKITNDGEFLVTWEQEINQIELRRLIKPE